MKTPVHQINVDLSHSSEAKALFEVVNAHMSNVSLSDEFSFFSALRQQSLEAVEMLESLEE
jgi:hypothetical protein